MLQEHRDRPWALSRSRPFLLQLFTFWRSSRPVEAVSVVHYLPACLSVMLCVLVLFMLIPPLVGVFSPHFLSLSFYICI